MKVIIIGAGKLGKKLASAMVNGEIEITLMDQDPQVLENLKVHMDVLTVNANGAQKKTLEELNIGSYDLAIAATSSDESNILIASMTKKLGCKRCVARVRNPEYASQLDYMKKLYDIDHIINPEQATADEIMRYLMESYSFYFDDYAKGKVSVVNFNIRSLNQMVHKSIQDIDLLSEIVIVAISRKGDIIIPNGKTVLLENDTLYMMGEKKKFQPIADLLKTSIKNKVIKKAMILGGSKMSFYLANALSEKNIQVKIIESNLSRCKVLSEQLPDNVLVVHGEGTDIDLLEEENLAGMDAFIGATGFDEENLFMSLRAKQLDISKVVSKISRESYVHIIEKLGIDMAINPVNIIASDILKYIRGGRVISVSLLLDGQAEVTEIVATKHLQVLDTPLKDLNLPKGIIIGAIVHKGKVHVPNGDSTIRNGDRLIVFSLLSQVPALETFFKLKVGK